ncbi:MAG TPA: acetolactate synthase small subunit [Verrucomicrobia bacterium]|nr:acetolactate synthase small subunit [Verrucomicrobiota bacterium]
MHTISVYVANRPGVLARIAQVFARRGFNIDSLVVSPSIDGRYSRMTIASQGSAEGLEQIILQLGKLVDVMRCVDHATDVAVIREMALVKLRVDTEQRTEALQICEHFAAKTVDLTEKSMIVMITGNSEKLDACINMLRKFEVVELVRTGKVVMARGDEET